MNVFLARLRAPGRPLALGVLVAALVLGAIDPAPLVELRLRVFDVAQKMWPRTTYPVSNGHPRVRIVDIDQDSIDRLGQWPWPRILVARLISRIAETKPLVLGVDLLFATPDRLSPPMLAKEVPDLPEGIAAALAQMPANDARLAEAIHRVPTVLGVALSNEPGANIGDPLSLSPIRWQDPGMQALLPVYRSATRSLPELAAAAAGSASITVAPDHDGVFRCLPIVAVWQGHVLPGFAPEILRTALHAGMTIATGMGGIAGAKIGDYVVPTDRQGRACMRFSPPVPGRFVSAASLLDPAFDPAELKDCIVLLGVTGLGGVDLQSTPLGLTYGIEVHAQLLDSILVGDLLHRPPAAHWIELAAVLLGGLAMIWLVRYERPLALTGAALAVLVIFVGGEFALFRFAGWLVDGVYAAIASLATLAAMVGGHLRAARAELERERERKARDEGEMAATRAIQMGLLPRRFPAFPERTDIDIYAAIEPARVAGGDLFDFLLLGDDRLFFLIANVSGKGIPAALIMSMTKEVVRDAALRHGDALDLLLAEASARIATAGADIAEEGGELQFVTAFAGMLDLASGALLFASAGHDAPFVLGPGRPLRSLGTEGGPPLGAVEDFAYPLDRDRLMPGEMLLLYTDGVSEAQNAAGSLYSVSRLSALLAGAPSDTARAAVDAVLADLRRFVGGAEQFDDITLLAVRRVAGATGR